MMALHNGDRERLEVSSKRLPGIGLVRSGTGTSLVGLQKTLQRVCANIRTLAAIRSLAFGYPHLEEAYRLSELLFPEIGLGQPRNQIRSSFGERQVFAVAAMEVMAKRRPDCKD